MQRTVRLLEQDLPAYHIGRRARLDQLARESQEESWRSVTALGLVLLMILGTAILIVWSIGEGWWVS